MTKTITISVLITALIIMARVIYRLGYSHGELKALEWMMGELEYTIKKIDEERRAKYGILANDNGRSAGSGESQKASQKV